MSSSPPPHDDYDSTRRRAPVGPGGPSFRSVARPLRDGVSELKQAPLAAAKAVPRDEEIIRKEDFLKPSGETDSTALNAAASRSSDKTMGHALWHPTHLRSPPAFYPLEKTVQLVQDCEPPQVAERLSECLRNLSIQAHYDDQSATAALLTGENVEMHLSLWKTPPHIPEQGVLVELQRRKGDSIAFHRYSKSILEAAASQEAIQHGVKPLGDVLYSRKVQRLLSMELQNKELQEHENALLAIEIAHGLLMKDRMDATQLGLESLCLLTDPSKTSHLTALLTAHVVLLGSTHDIQIPGALEYEQTELHEDIRRTILNRVLSQDYADTGNAQEADQYAERMDIDQEHTTLLRNLALAVLANALDVIENCQQFLEEDNDGMEEDSKPPAANRVRTSSSSDVTVQDFMTKADGTADKTSILKTLIQELGRAQYKPHNATLSAKCLGSLCRASREARDRAKDHKTIVRAALEVGTKTHLKLETECKKVVKVLEQMEP